MTAPNGAAPDAPPPSLKVPKWLGPAVSLGFTLLILIVFELVAAYVVVPRNVLMQIMTFVEPDRDLLWRQKRSRTVDFQGRTVTLNALGFRGPEVDTPKPAGTFRIVNMGASPTFGWGVSDEGAIPQALAVALAGHKQVEVINAGVIGYTSHQGRRLWENSIRALEPDVVTFGYQANEAARVRFFQSGLNTDREVLPESESTIRLQRTMYKSAFVVACKVGTQGWFNSPAGGDAEQPANEERLVAKQDAPVRVPPAHYKENLIALVKTASAAGARTILIRMPLNPIPAQKLQKHRDYLKFLDEYRAVMDQVVAETGAPMIDAQARFTAEGPGRQNELFVSPEADLVHPSVEGNKMVAELIARYLREQHILPGS